MRGCMHIESWGGDLEHANSNGKERGTKGARAQGTEEDLERTQLAHTHTHSDTQNSAHSCTHAVHMCFADMYSQTSLKTTSKGLDVVSTARRFD